MCFLLTLGILALVVSVNLFAQIKPSEVLLIEKKRRVILLIFINNSPEDYYIWQFIIIRQNILPVLKVLHRHRVDLCRNPCI
jgi:hypothetical protein